MSFTLKCNNCGNENELISYWEIYKIYTVLPMEEHKEKVYVDYGDQEFVCQKCGNTKGQ